MILMMISMHGLSYLFSKVLKNLLKTEQNHLNISQTNSRRKIKGKSYLVSAIIVEKTRYLDKLAQKVDK